MILTLPSHRCVLTLLKLSTFALDNISTDNPSCGPIFSFHSNFCDISCSRVKCCLCLHLTPVILLFLHFDVGYLYLLHVPTSTKFVLLHTTRIIHSVPARLGKGQGANEIGHNLAREQPEFGHNLVRKRHKIGHTFTHERPKFGLVGD